LLSVRNRNTLSFIRNLTFCLVQQTALSNIPNGQWSYSAYNGYKHLASGLCCGLSSLAAGLCIGVAGDAGVRANAQKDIYVGVILILIFAEALGLYGLIISIILSSLSQNYLN
jgi:F0F1-type ATP synthase membrane subunit c/vacuolar-type H+-ATPase subunit K